MTWCLNIFHSAYITQSPLSIICSQNTGEICLVYPYQCRADTPPALKIQERSVCAPLSMTCRYPTTSQNTGEICLCTPINDMQIPHHLSKYRRDLSVHPYQWHADTPPPLKIQEWSVCVPLSITCRHPTSSPHTGVICLCTPINDMQIPHHLSKYRRSVCVPLSITCRHPTTSRNTGDLSVYPSLWHADTLPALKIQERSVCVCDHWVHLRSWVFMSSPLYPALNTVTRVSLECHHGLTKALYGDQRRASCLPTGRERRWCHEGWGTHCFWRWPPEKTFRCTMSCAHSKRWCASCNRESFKTGENLTLSLPIALDVISWEVFPRPVYTQTQIRVRLKLEEEKREKKYFLKS